MFKTLALAALVVAAPVFAAEVETQNLINTIGGVPQLLIPAAGAVQGANGTFFRSDITLINYTTHNQRVLMRWLPNGVSGNSIAAREITINALTGLNSEDFVSTVLQQSGLGAILISGVTAEGVLDESARLFATSRIWSNQPGLSSGTVSQTFPALGTANINSSVRQSIAGLRRDERYRLNVGVVNLDSTNEQTFQVVAGGTGQPLEVYLITVPPRSMVQASLPGGLLPNLQVLVQNATTTNRTNTWVAYGSSVDNVTGDSWSEIGYTAPTDQATITTQ